MQVEARGRGRGTVCACVLLMKTRSKLKAKLTGEEGNSSTGKLGDRRDQFKPTDTAAGAQKAARELKEAIKPYDFPLLMTAENPRDIATMEPLKDTRVLVCGSLYLAAFLPK